MVVAIHIPAFGINLEEVRLAVVVGVLDACNVWSLGDIKPTVFPSEAQNFVHAVGKA